MNSRPERLIWASIELDESQWFVAATEKGICRIIFPHESMEHWRSWFDQAASQAALQEDKAAIQATGVLEKLRSYFSGETVSFADVPLDLIGTEFQKQVWLTLGSVPYGETRTYGDIAAAVGRPNASRAIGAASGANPVPILLPCHRIISKDKKLTGFRGGLAMKKKLLTLEGIKVTSEAGHERFKF